MFAFCLVDFTHRRFLLARDQLGIKPLFWTADRRRLAFASELAALRLLPGLDATLDWEAVDQYLQLQYIPPPRTVFRAVCKLPPAHAFEDGEAAASWRAKGFYPSRAFAALPYLGIGDVADGARVVTEDGRMALHDLIGCWGSQVREAAARFLEAFPYWRLEHPDYADLYWSLGFLRRTREAVLESRTPPRPGLVRPGLLRHFAEALARLFPGAGLAVAGAPPELFPWLAAVGFADTVILEDEPNANRPDDLPVLPWAALAASGRRFDVVLCLGTLERRPPGDEARLLDALTGAGDTLVFAATPVGERGGDAPNQRPIAWWAARLLERGYVLHDSLRPLLEPWTFPTGARDKRVESSALATLLVARKARLPLTDKDWAAVYLEHQRRLESLTLQQIALAHFYWNQEWRREAYEGYLRDAQRENARLRERLARLEGRASDGGED